MAELKDLKVGEHVLVPMVIKDFDLEEGESLDVLAERPGGVRAWVKHEEVVLIPVVWKNGDVAVDTDGITLYLIDDMWRDADGNTYLSPSLGHKLIFRDGKAV